MVQLWCSYGTGMVQLWYPREPQLCTCSAARPDHDHEPQHTPQEYLPGTATGRCLADVALSVNLDRPGPNDLHLGLFSVSRRLVTLPQAAHLIRPFHAAVPRLLLRVSRLLLPVPRLPFHTPRASCYVCIDLPRPSSALSPLVLSPVTTCRCGRKLSTRPHNSSTRFFFLWLTTKSHYASSPT